jgi:hypothetical protein
MAIGAGRVSAKAKKQGSLKDAFDQIIAGPPYTDGFDPLDVSREALERLPTSTNISKPLAKKLRQKFDRYIGELADFRARLDPVRDPDSTFDPSNPDTVGRLVVLALLAQERVPLRQISPTYGSGVYAIYYIGEHPAYSEVTRTETPIYVGKADPDQPMASTPRQQGVRLFTRLTDHRKAIQEVETYCANNGLSDALHVDDFECRRLVCATNAQLVAERHLIDVFKPAWNSETKICFGISKHGDNADVRRNKKSPWDVLHPGKSLALNSPVKDGMTPATVVANLTRHFSDNPPHRDLEAVIQIMLDSFRQVAMTSVEISEAAVDTDEVVEAREADEREQAGHPELDLD